MRPYVNESDCIACGVCQDVCPADPNVFEIEDTAKVANPDACTGCLECQNNCPVSCIEVKDE